MRHTETRHNRRGAAGVWAVVLLAAGGLAAALALTPAALGPARAAAQSAADAVALAAAGELADGGLAPAGHDPEAAARAAADEYARANGIGDGVTSVRFGGHPTAVQVVIRQAVRNPFPGLLGRPPAEVLAGATAVVDRGVIGFRPAAGGHAPVVPLALPSDPTGRRDTSWEHQIEGGHGGDRFRFDPATRRFAPDPDGDGLPEITVPFSPNGVIPLGLGAASDMPSRISVGLTADDLCELGRQFIAAIDRPVSIRVDDDPPCEATWAALDGLRVRGEPRAWPLADGIDPTTGTARVTRLVAARVVALTPPTAGRPAALTLQPCVVLSGSAVTGGPPNPYLAKVRLVD